MATLQPTSSTAWHTMTVADIYRELHSSPQGLAAAEARIRLAQSGLNELEKSRRVSAWRILYGQFGNVLLVILIIATGLSAFLGHGTEAIVIGVIVLFAVGLGFFQEYRAERAMEALGKMAALQATVIRDGVETQVPARDLAPGDVVLLKAGDKVPADCRLIEISNLQAEEAALTGESTPVEKQTEPLTRHDLPAGDRTNMAYAGTAVNYGRGRGIVVATGMATEFGKIARLLQSVETTRTPLQVNLDRVGRTLAKVALAIVLLIVVAGWWRQQQSLTELLIFGIALAVAVVPEALPAVVTVSLAIGVQRMARRHALIRHLPAVETLGSTSVICSDKTGTLTRDEMTVRQVYLDGQTIDVSGAGYEPRGEPAHYRPTRAWPATNPPVSGACTAIRPKGRSWRRRARRASSKRSWTRSFPAWAKSRSARRASG
jgi:Ca2+-transporting ATPase